MFKKIGFRLIFVVALTSLVIIGVYAYFNVKSQSSSSISEVERHANQLGETVISSTRFDMMLNQRDRIQQTINSIGTQPQIRDVRIINKDGEIIYSSDSININKMVDKQAESCYACHAEDKPLEHISITERTRIFRVHPDSNRLIGIITPIYNEKSCWNADCHAHPQNQKVLGVLDVSISLAEIDKAIVTREWEIVIFAIIAIIAVGLLIAFFVRHWVSNPVHDLLNATQQVSQGNLNYAIKDLGDNEIGKLGESFNNMTKKLSEARMQLFQSDKMASLGRLAAGVAHEINNPLTGVLTYSSFLLKRTKDNPELQEDLKVIVRETLRSREIVKSLLDFARQSVPKKSIADINEIIEKSIGVIEKQLSIKKIKIVKQSENNLPRITVDSNQMQQVFINLFVNASDAISKDGGTITVITKQISLSPFGVAQIKKAACPKRHSLIDNEFKIDGLPALKVKVVSNGKEGIVHLDPVYGKHRNHFDLGFDVSTEAKFVCPDCNSSIVQQDKLCPQCAAPVLSFEISGQGVYEVCSSENSNWEKWDFVDSAGLKEFIEIKISDTGCGITKDDLPKIFEPFFSTKGQKGTGLGLAVIWGIIDNHNGTITVESEEGKGTNFIIRLPLTPQK
ncbi:MAG: two-component sensor histidine kinase [Ignavibacteria bacterium RIFOXYB2_FULL_35_12]|nr:MAG: two-component sensor histidine kinase [Ignavibacteria bacterium GWA2_36_19]OGU58415.1 MAG: two-component sensor histidine kinase [Ignavibacteria bacterium GWF2_35_20]OGU83234.1 MAG: two-component sensor histidine kinase [Ignavibacteria bacterium RIFOXYA2_FULL_35_9]OGU86609.1 MAG: two-component sensor histidine kinase [Ignavibacteria bacterium RIFOXYC12_FULL_35_11]OGU92147.1 MAG: two-component sensor histidine kinase [Ignavibacteria bacterium RIFOXYA12_FULL_35_25]OGU93301.1 MAG: two-com